MMYSPEELESDMRMLVATDGMLPVEPTVAHIERLYEAGDSVTVMTAINLPRRLLEQLKAVTATGGSTRPTIDEIVDAAGPGHMGLAGGDRVAERLASTAVDTRPIDEFLAHYRAELARTSTQPMVDALAAAGIQADTLVRETEEKTAAAVLDACRERRIDLLIMGSTGRGRFVEGFVGSVGTKLFRHAPCDVLLIRVPDGG
jgi:nucleotide-binding universal stress UspA family protein